MYLDKSSTERLLIRPLELSDIDRWATFFDNNDSLKFFNFDLSLGNRSVAKGWIEKQIERYENNQFGLMALIDKSSNELIGQCGLLTQEVDGRQELEIGYHILPEYWGKGFATEAAVFFKAFAFENNISENLISIIHIDNIRSQRVAEKNGMQRTIQTEFRTLPVYIYRITKIQD